MPQQQSPEAIFEEELPSSRANIHRETTLILARAVQSRVAEYPKKRQLTEAYDHINELIMMNETAIEDALAYVKAIKEVDEVSAAEQHSQIMELVVSINQEKERRTAASVSLIVYSWTGQKERLAALLRNKPSADQKSMAKHEKCAAISSQIGEKDGELVTLEMQSNDQLEAANAVQPSAKKLGKDLEFKRLKQLSERLTKEQTAKELLIGERQKVLTCFLQGDAEIRELVKDSILGKY